MNNQLLKTIFFGALLGAAIFAAPFFVLKVLLFFLVIGFFFRIFRGRGYYGRRGWGYWGKGGPWAYADKVRDMSDEEYSEFKEKYQGGCGPGSSHDSKNQRGSESTPTSQDPKGPINI